MPEGLLLLLGGLTLLIAGGELLVRGSVQTATCFGVSPLIIGLTLVGFGTSTPELVTSIQAALMDAPGIAYGNIVGSNIANILLIGGLAALVYPMAVAPNALKRDGIVMLAVATIFTLLASVFPLERWLGAIFISALVTYVYLAIRQERRASGRAHNALYEKSVALQQVDSALVPATARLQPMARSVFIVVAGIGMVVTGGMLLINGGVDLARSVGVSETVIGLTVIAVGTSVPELVTSTIAAFKRQSEVAFGNIVGSNIYNILGIGGATALTSPGAVPDELVRFDNLVMVAVSAAIVLFAYTGRRIGRREGAVLLAGYAVYVYCIWP